MPGTLCPIETWLSDEVIDSELRVPIAKARLEFKGKSEDDVAALWDQLEVVLHGWPMSAGPLPTYRAEHRLEYAGHEVIVVYEGPGRGTLIETSIIHDITRA